VRAIDRKLLRDLAQMKAQAVTIALVIACGVAALVAALATYHSLRRSQEAFYVESHFADVFASLKRAPLALQPAIEAIPGVAVVELRVVHDVTLDVPGSAAPPVGRIITQPVTRPDCPWLIVQGDQDELVDCATVREWGAAFDEPPQMRVLEGAEHFFHGRLGELRAAVMEFLSGPGLPGH